MIALYLPRALVLKEWLHQRWYALIAFVCISPSVLLMPWLASTTRIAPYSGPVTNHLPIIHMTAHQTLAYEFGNYIQYFMGHSTGLWAAWVVMGLAVMSWANEQQSGALWFTLTGPVTRKVLVRTKYLAGISIIIAICTILDAYMLCLNAFVHLGAAPVWILYWWFAELAILTCAYSIAFTMAVLINNPAIAVLLTYVVCRTPDYFDRLFARAYTSAIDKIIPPASGLEPVSYHIFGIVEHLTPFQMRGPIAGIAPYIVWCIVLSGICYFTAQRLFQTIRSEHLLDLVRLPRLRRWAMALFCLLTSLTVTEMLFRPVPRSVKFLILVCLAVLLWRIAKMIIPKAPKPTNSNGPALP